MKSFKLSNHAKEKMEIRSVKTSDVYASLRMPDHLYEDIENETLVGIKKVNGNSIIVVYRMESEVAKVITLFYTSKLERLIKTKVARGAWKKVK